MVEPGDELDRIGRLSSDSVDYQKEFLKIHNEKLKTICQVRVAMFGLHIACHVYKWGVKECEFLEDIPEDIDFESLANKIRDRFGDKYAEKLIIFGEGKFDQDISIIDKLFSLNYEPPSDIISIYNHLGCLEACYEHFIKIPPTLLYMRLDLSLSQLLCVAHTTIYRSLTHVKNELTRLKKSAKSLLIKKNKKKDMAIIMFYEIDTKGMKLSKIIQAITKKINDRGVIIHSKTVKRYLMSDTKVKADLEAMGVINRQT